MQLGSRNRFEKGRVRRCTQIAIGSNNAFTKGYMLWPEDAAYDGIRIQIGEKNYFNKNVMIDACGKIEIGNYNMFGPDVYITDANHSFGKEVSPSMASMQVGQTKIGNHCWIGAKAIILKDVVLGDYCVVAAGAVVTKSFPSGSLVGGVPAKLLKTL
ncbi:MAG: acyltransferase [Filimonas sp.]|nr:acyltransferase [Filimonas sp.]